MSRNIVLLSWTGACRYAPVMLMHFHAVRLSDAYTMVASACVFSSARAFSLPLASARAMCVGRSNAQQQHKATRKNNTAFVASSPGKPPGCGFFVWQTLTLLHFYIKFSSMEKAHGQKVSFFIITTNLDEYRKCLL